VFHTFSFGRLRVPNIVEILKAEPEWRPKNAVVGVEERSDHEAARSL